MNKRVVLVTLIAVTIWGLVLLELRQLGQSLPQLQVSSSAAQRVTISAEDAKSLLATQWAWEEPPAAR
jgi:hypothetical protein